MVERVNHEKQALVEQLHQEQRRLEQTISNKEHTMQLQEQKLGSVSDELLTPAEKLAQRVRSRRVARLCSEVAPWAV